MKLTLGKGSTFIKSRLRCYPQQDGVWEADYQPIPNKQRTDFWLGMVVNQELGVELAHDVLDAPPTVNHLARLLADAIQHPIIEGSRHRPRTLLLRNDPQWKELLPHLRELGIEIVMTDSLPAWKKAARNGGIEHARAQLSFAPPRVTEDTLLAHMFPTIGKWVRCGGWIEIGEQEGTGFMVRALDEGGLAFEDAEPRTLDEAMAALEAGIAKWTKDNAIDLG